MSGNQEEFFVVPGSEVIWANLRALRQTQLEQKGFVKYKTIAQINDLLLNRLSIISTPHTSENSVHAAVATDGRLARYFRPNNYGRACIAEVEGYFFELKGVGVPYGQAPKNIPYGNGLMFLHNAVYESALSSVCSEFISNVNCARSQAILAIVKLPIRSRMFTGNHANCYASIIVREPAVRVPDSKEGFKTVGSNLHIRSVIELAVRKGLITSCAPFGKYRVWSSSGVWIGRTDGEKDENNLTPNIVSSCRSIGVSLPNVFDVANVQVATSIDSRRLLVVDFEHYNARDSFPDATMVPTAADPVRQFVQILPSLDPVGSNDGKRTILHDYINMEGIEARFPNCYREFGLLTGLHYFTLKVMNLTDGKKRVENLLKKIYTKRIGVADDIGKFVI